MNKGTITGWRYFVIHLCVEIVCFATLRTYYSLEIAGLIALSYDFFAFVPQGLIGQYLEKNRRFPMGTIGVVLMTAGVYLTLLKGSMPLVGICIMALGNAALHEKGAIETVVKSEGKIFPSAIFVAGGSFGVVIGQTMGKFQVNLLWLLIPLAVIELLLLFPREKYENVGFPTYNCVRFGKTELSSPEFPIALIILAAFFVTAVRSFIGYAIPISWKKELWQDFLLFFVMGIGKGLGGYLADRFGAQWIGVLSTLLAIPFLIIGVDNMVISVIGVCLFSMTMCITFEMIMSVLPKNPGISFGVTTLALFVGFVPSFFVEPGIIAKNILVITFSIICAVLLFFTCNNKTIKNNQVKEM